jgi:hypothetical protein
MQSHQFECYSAYVGVAAALVLTAPLLQGAPGFQIASVSERGSGDDGRRHAIVRGTFVGFEDARAVATCNGRPIAAAIASGNRTLLDISIPEPPGGTRCTFSLERVTDGARSEPSAASTLVLRDPPNEITGSRDLGISGGRHAIELYGAFSTPGVLDATSGVTCNGSSAPNVRQQWTGTHFNVSFDDIGEARCTFVFGYGDGRRTNLWGPLNLRPYSPLTGFGTYLWSTETRPRTGEDDAMESPTLPLFRGGFDVIRVQMAPNWRGSGFGNNHYKFNVDLLNGDCPPGVPFLPCAARLKAFQQIASSPSTRVVMMTVADAASAGREFNSDSWASGSPVRRAVVKEYRDLALALYETQANTGKLFIVSSYESDNGLFCGCGIVDFVSDAGQCRTRCEMGALPHWKVMEFLRAWFQARHEGIQLAKSIAASRHLQNVTVADAIEISSIRWLHNTTTCRKIVDGGPAATLPHCPNILDDVVPVVQPAYVSWSAWEGIRDDLPGHQPYPFSGMSATSMPGRTPRLDADLLDLKARLAAMPGSPQLIIGEFGIEDNPDFSDDATSWANGEIAKSIQRAQLPVNVAWAGYDSIEGGSVHPYGLFQTDGREKRGMIALRRALTEGAAEMAALPNPPGRIAGIVASAVRQAGTDFDLFEVFGAFPTPPLSSADIALVCNGVRITAPDLTWLAATTSQVNFRISHDNTNTMRYCSVKLPGTWTHGPKKLWPGRCPQAAVCR